MMFKEYLHKKGLRHDGGEASRQGDLDDFECVRIVKEAATVFQPASASFGLTRLCALCRAMVSRFDDV